MTDDATPSTPAPRVSPTAKHHPAPAGSSSGFAVPAAAPAPAGHGFRRSMTIDESSLRRRSSQPSLLGAESPAPTPRRSSNFSDYSLHEARDLLNPRPSVHKDVASETSSLASLSLAFALLPALAGAVVKDGHVFVTDLLLLGLAGVFLHWSVTQPWSWYHSAQEVRVHHQAGTDAAIYDDSDMDSAHDLVDSDAGTKLDDVPEEDVEQEARSSPATQPASDHHQGNATRQAALRELYLHEVLALASCFVLPVLSAYLLHAIRSQLSRPSEGLVSNYNLSIFLLVSELRAFHHTIKLVHARTLHLQRLVHANPYETASTNGREHHMEELVSRLERLESRSKADEALLQHMNQGNSASDAERNKQEATLARDVRNAIQPELDALNRAVRRYEKKTTLLQQQTEARFGHAEARLSDAIALAAAAAKNSASHKNALRWVIDSLVWVVLLPFNTILQLLLLPLRTLLAVFSRRPEHTHAPRARMGRSGKPGSVGRYNGDRVPSRVSKR